MSLDPVELLSCCINAAPYEERTKAMAANQYIDSHEQTTYKGEISLFRDCSSLVRFH